MEFKVWDEPKICFKCKKVVKAGQKMYKIKRGRFDAYIGDCCKNKRRLKR